MEHKVKVGIVEDQKLFREGLIAIMSGWPDITMVFTSPDGYSVEKRLEEATEIPDVMLLDLTLPNDGTLEFDGVKVLAMLRKKYPAMKTIILSANHDPYIIAQLIELGAQGYLVKDSDPDEVHQAIVHVYEQGSYINEKVLNAIQQRLQGKVKKTTTHEGISPRELDVLILVCQQFTSKEIAEKLFISEKTVNGHRNNLLQKTGARNVTGLVIYAAKHNLVTFV